MSSSSDLEEQEDELLALHSIFSSEEFVRNESKPAGEIRVSVELPADFTVALTEGDAVRRYDISFLPPLLLTFELPDDYPTSSPPSFTLTCSWLTHTQLSALAAQLTELYQATGGAVVLFSWVQFLKEDALGFLDIHTLLELHSDEHRNTAPSETDNNKDTTGLKSGSTDDRSCEVSDLPASPLEDQCLNLSLADGQSQSISDQSGQSSTTHASDVKEAGKTSHSSEYKENSSNEDDVSASSVLPSGSLGEDQSGREGAAPPASCQNKARRPRPPSSSGPSLTPSQALLSQLLIHDAAQRQRAFASTVFDCGVCFVGSLGSDCEQLPDCGHVFCRTCLTQFCKLQITEGNVQSVTCPQADCTASPTPAQVRSLVGEELFSRYDRLLLQSTLDLMPDVAYCPRRSCGSAVILEKSSTAAMCYVCSFAFCVTCRKTYHGAGDCPQKKAVKELIEDLQQKHAELPESQEGMQALWEDYASGSQERQRLLQSRYGAWALQCDLEDSLSEHWMEFNCKNCPHCFCRIQKNQGCNSMTCSQCRRHFCWACLERDPTGGHFNDNPFCLYEWN